MGKTYEESIDRQYTYKEKRDIWKRLMSISEDYVYKIWERNQDDPITKKYAEKIKDELHTLGVEYDFHWKFPKEN